MKRSNVKQGRHVFDIPSIATHLRGSLYQVQSELRRLQAAGEIAYEVGDSALCFTGLQIPDDICLLTSKITKGLAEVEHCQVRKLDAMSLAASAAVRKVNWTVPQESNVTVSGEQATLQSCIKSYFEGEDDGPISKTVPTSIQSSSVFGWDHCGGPYCSAPIHRTGVEFSCVCMEDHLCELTSRSFLKSARNPLMTGRAVARIFHGLWSPAFPYSEWSKSHFWGLHAKVDFEIIKDAAAEEILVQHTSNRDDFRDWS